MKAIFITYNYEVPIDVAFHDEERFFEIYYAAAYSFNDGYATRPRSFEEIAQVVHDLYNEHFMLEDFFYGHWRVYIGGCDLGTYWN